MSMEQFILTDVTGKAEQSKKSIREENDVPQKLKCEKEKLGVEDFFAICIAIFEIVMPMVLVSFLILTIVLLIFTVESG